MRERGRKRERKVKGKGIYRERVKGRRERVKGRR